MCQYVTLLLPQGAGIEGLQRVCEREKGFIPVENPSVLAQAQPGDRYFRATGGVCDCGTPLGRGNNFTGRVSLDEARETARLRKKGWGDARIARWLDEKRTERMRDEEATLARVEANHQYATFWVDFLTNALTSGYTPRLTLLLHWYRRGLEDEKFPELPQETVPLSRVTPELLTYLKEDTLYHFVVG